MQKEVAEALGVEVNTVVGWEIGRAQPKVSYLSRIIAFLGYDPLPQGTSLGERLRAEQLGVYKDTITLVERLGPPVPPAFW